MTFTRPIGLLRVGILTITEKWQHLFKSSTVSYQTEDYLSGKYPSIVTNNNLLINGALIPSLELAEICEKLEINSVVMYGDEIICGRFDQTSFEIFKNTSGHDHLTLVEVDFAVLQIKILKQCFEIFSWNGEEIKNDFKLITKNKKSETLSESNRVIGNQEIFIEEGCVVECCIFNTQEGPVYIGKNCLIMEGSMIRGPFAMGEQSVVKMGAKIYANTTLGPGCKVGGEIQNVVFQANSNKAHDGYLGNSVVGEWCNIGAGTDCSNLKNNYEEVKLWSYEKSGFVKTGLQFCGIIMGDHSKIAIGVTVNTGTVIGVCVNLFGSGFPRNFVPSYSWGGHAGFKTYDIKKALETAERVLQRRTLFLSEEDVKILQYTFVESSKYRNWES